MENTIIAQLATLMSSLSTESELITYFDRDVEDCIMQMYFYMLTEKEEHYKKFISLYNKLNHSEQEKVKEEYHAIIEEQDKNTKRINLHPIN